MNNILQTPRRTGKSYLAKTSDKLVGMMKDLDLIIRILDTMQEREYTNDARKIKEREDRLRRERGEIALQLLHHWIVNGDAKHYPEVGFRLGMMLNIPADRIEAIVDDLAHVYERRYNELAHRAIAKEKQIREESRHKILGRFQKKTPLVIFDEIGSVV